MKPPLLNITIPVYNEERTLASSIQKISAFLKSNCSQRYEIVIAENGSTDKTFDVAKQLEQELPNVRALRVNEKGRGRAIKTAWQQSNADILSYMDVDLSADLVAFPLLIDALATEPNRREYSREDSAIPSPRTESTPHPALSSVEEERDSLATVRGFKARSIIRRSLSSIEQERELLRHRSGVQCARADFLSAKRTSVPKGGYDLAIGSRLLDPALTRRGFKRETISRGYNLLVRAVFRTRFSDAQCGFKAITRRAAAELLPLIEDNAWFMDTELLVLAEKLGYRIFDLPVRWTDDPDSRVQLWSTALADIKGLMRVRRNLASGRYSSRHQITLAATERGVGTALQS